MMSNLGVWKDPPVDGFSMQDVYIYQLQVTYSECMVLHNGLLLDPLSFRANASTMTQPDRTSL